ncbi:MAG: response regulator [Bacteroidota bacterium]|nr:response regulator [Bacteroidota bacterium]
MTQPFPLLRRPLNFLLVDDDDICLFIHRRVLELTDYCRSVHSASNGKTALEILQRAAMGAMPVPDIILLDLDMPLMNGLGFLDAYNKLSCMNKGQIAVVLLTSSVSEKDQEYAFSRGASECLAKPLTQAALNSLVSRLYRDGLPPPLMQACM